MKSKKTVTFYGLEWKNANGQLYREDGPAVIWDVEIDEWWLDGKPYSKQTHKLEIVKRNIEKLKVQCL